MLNKTKDTAIVSDTDAYVFYEKYNENDLLSKYIHRENIDKLKKTAWFSRRKKWNIPFRHSDLVMIRKAICQHPDNWESHLADTIRLSESRCWVDWIITGAYQYWQNKNHGELITLKNTYDECLINE
ncbi:T3SS regulon anti-activator ExsD family protein, partial [Morganella morganii subsp. sibonii]